MEKIECQQYNSWSVIPTVHRSTTFGMSLVRVERSGTSAKIDVMHDSDEQVLKDAYLIAAAPLLLSALIDLISICEENPSVPGQWWSKGVPTNDQLNMAKSAIAKATNTTQP